MHTAGHQLAFPTFHILAAHNLLRIGGQQENLSVRLEVIQLRFPRKIERTELYIFPSALSL